MSAIVEARAGQSLTDEAVVSLVLAGDTHLYEVLVRRNNQRVYRAVRAVLQDDSEAEDAMQQAYVSAFRNLAQFRGSARFSTWLVRIAVHEARARIRRRNRLVELVDPEAGETIDEVEDSRMDGALDPERQTSERELAAVLQLLIEGLPEKLRTVFVLREVEGMSTAEVAEALELSEDNVKTRLHRAKSALRERMSERLGAAAVHVWLFENPRCDAVSEGVMRTVAAFAWFPEELLPKPTERE